MESQWGCDPAPRIKLILMQPFWCCSGFSCSVKVSTLLLEPTCIYSCEWHHYTRREPDLWHWLGHLGYASKESTSEDRHTSHWYLFMSRAREVEPPSNGVLFTVLIFLFNRDYASPWECQAEAMSGTRPCPWLWKAQCWSPMRKGGPKVIHWVARAPSMTPWQVALVRQLQRNRIHASVIHYTEVGHTVMEVGFHMELTRPRICKGIWQGEDLGELRVSFQSKSSRSRNGQS